MPIGALLSTLLEPSSGSIATAMRPPGFSTTAPESSSDAIANAPALAQVTFVKVVGIQIERLLPVAIMTFAEDLAEVACERAPGDGGGKFCRTGSDGFDDGGDDAAVRIFS